ncbi:MAG: hypothetical protein WC861_04715 [Candidatus Micrarchaeia archaeon]|jgi:hypothetical protein
MAIIRTGIKADRFKADEVAAQHGGRLPSHAELDACIMRGYPCRPHLLGSFWAKELAVSGITIEKGKDIVDEVNMTIIQEKDVKRMLELRKEEKDWQGRTIPTETLFYLVNPEAFTKKDDFYLVENPSIILVEKVALDCWGGKADNGTRIAIPDDKYGCSYNSALRTAIREFFIPQRFFDDIDLRYMKMSNSAVVGLKAAMDLVLDSERRWNTIDRGIQPLARSIRSATDLVSWRTVESHRRYRRGGQMRENEVMVVTGGEHANTEKIDPKSQMLANVIETIEDMKQKGVDSMLLGPIIDFVEWADDVIPAIWWLRKKKPLSK